MRGSQKTVMLQMYDDVKEYDAFLEIPIPKMNNCSRHINLIS